MMPVEEMPTRQHPAQNRALAVLLLLAGFFIFTLVDAGSKRLTEEYHTLEITFGRAVFQVLPLLLIFAWRGLGVARSSHPKLQALRGVAIYICTVLFVQGLSLLDLADCTALAYISPFVVVLFSIWLLKEKVDWQRWLAVAIGFFGVLIVLVVQIGLISPPVGMNLFVLNALLKDVSLPQIFRGVWLFVAVLVLALGLCLEFQPLALWLPGFMR